MLILNIQMKNLLSDISACNTVKTDEYKIIKKENAGGKAYFCAHEPCLGYVMPENDCLTDFEWDTNEVYHEHDDIKSSIAHGLAIKNAWKKQMELDFPETAFDIFMSADIGDEEIPPSVTLRFHAVRDGVHYIKPTQEEIDKFSQPLLMEKVNY
ncbi:MAG: hypothetical protein IJW21_05295 [Clostridia bacterium]|nr:hypothetical protein [Clostridia bacterium]